MDAEHRNLPHFRFPVRNCKSMSATRQARSLPVGFMFLYSDVLDFERRRDGHPMQALSILSQLETVQAR